MREGGAIRLFRSLSVTERDLPKKKAIAKHINILIINNIIIEAIEIIVEGRQGRAIHTREAIEKPFTHTHAPTRIHA